MGMMSSNSSCDNSFELRNSSRQQFFGFKLSNRSISKCRKLLLIEKFTVINWLSSGALENIELEATSTVDMAMESGS